MLVEEIIKVLERLRPKGEYYFQENYALAYALAVGVKLGIKVVLENIESEKNNK